MKFVDKGELFLWGLLPKGLSFRPNKQIIGDESRKVLSISFGPTFYIALVYRENDDVIILISFHSLKL